MPKRLSTIRTSALLGPILLLAVLLRAGFFVGLVSGDPQDDGIYYANALALFTDGPRHLERFRSLPADFLANPIDQFHVRPMVTYPIAASFALFGQGELPATLWAGLCSTLSVLVAYRLGFVLHGRTVGLVAALLCAFYPLEVINGTRILSDVQLGLFSSVALLLLVEASLWRNAALYALSGAAAAGAYLANGRGLLFLIALLACGTLLAVFAKGELARARVDSRRFSRDLQRRGTVSTTEARATPFSAITFKVVRLNTSTCTSLSRACAGDGSRSDIPTERRSISFEMSSSWMAGLQTSSASFFSFFSRRPSSVSFADEICSS